MSEIKGQGHVQTEGGMHFVSVAPRLAGFFSAIRTLTESCQQYISDWVQRLAKKRLRDFTHTSPNFTWESKSAKYGLDFQPQSHLRHFGFEMEQSIENRKYAVGAQMVYVLSDISPISLNSTGVRKSEILPFRL